MTRKRVKEDRSPLSRFHFEIDPYRQREIAGLALFALGGLVLLSLLLFSLLERRYLLFFLTTAAAGILLASALGYLLARGLGREFVERVGGAKVRRAEQILRRRGFMPLIAVRFLPVPFSLVNAAAAVVGVRFGKFLLASALGYLPPIAIITYFTSALMNAASGERAATAREFVMVSVTAAILVFLPIGIRRRQRQLRLRALRAHRAGRRGNGTVS